MSKTDIWWDEKRLTLISKDFSKQVGYDDKRKWGILKISHKTYLKAYPGKVLLETDAPYNTAPLVESEDVNIGDFIFCNKEGSPIWPGGDLGGRIYEVEEKIDNILACKFPGVIMPMFSIFAYAEFLNNEIYVIDSRFVQMMGWGNEVEKNKNPDIETCPNGHPITCFQGAPYCPTCNTIQLVNEYTGMPTGKWIKRF